MEIANYQRPFYCQQPIYDTYPSRPYELPQNATRNISLKPSPLKPIQAIGQICSTSSLNHNLSQCQTLIQKASSLGAKALFLPEASDYIASNAAQTVSLCQPVDKSEFVLGIQDSAKKHNLPIHVGVHEPTEDGKKVKNTLLWINEQGEIAHRYQKLHLFDVDIANGPILKESNSVERGNVIPTPFESPLGKIGPLICFDLRFPEPSLALRRRGAQILTYPSAFTVPTGQAHWETLLRARAIETQSYVIAAAQVGFHNEEKTRRSYGHSLIVDPWGRIIAKLGGEEDGNQGNGVGEIAVAEVDLEALEKVRREVPLLRRTDVYPEII